MGYTIYLSTLKCYYYSHHSQLTHHRLLAVDRVHVSTWPSRYTPAGQPLLRLRVPL
jgi:hypothetical protein